MIQKQEDFTCVLLLSVVPYSYDSLLWVTTAKLY